MIFDIFFSFLLFGIDFELYVVTFENSSRISNQKLNDAGFCCGESRATWAGVISTAGSEANIYNPWDPWDQKVFFTLLIYRKSNVDVNMYMDPMSKEIAREFGTN